MHGLLLTILTMPVASTFLAMRPTTTAMVTILMATNGSVPPLATTFAVAVPMASGKLKLPYYSFRENSGTHFYHLLVCKNLE